MKKFLFGILIGGVLGIVAGAMGMIVAYPFIFLAGIVADEKSPDVDAASLRAEGMFIHANPMDPVHYGSGKVRVYNDVVRLESDFEVGPGPKYKVLLHTKANIRDTDDVPAGRYVDIGRLRAFKGSQNYPIPAGVDLSEIKSVVIWCEAFGVLISPADLTAR